VLISSSVSASKSRKLLFLIFVNKVKNKTLFFFRKAKSTLILHFFAFDYQQLTEHRLRFIVMCAPLQKVIFTVNTLRLHNPVHLSRLGGILHTYVFINLTATNRTIILLYLFSHLLFIGFMFTHNSPQLVIGTSVNSEAL